MGTKPKKSIYISESHHTAVVHAAEELGVFMDDFIEQALEANPTFKKWFAKGKK